MAPIFDTVHAWRLSDGSRRWTREVGERTRWLLADAKMVYLDSSQHLQALRNETGQARWQVANPANLTQLSEEGGLLLGMNPLTSTLVGYAPSSGQRLFQLQPQALDAYIVI